MWETERFDVAERVAVSKARLSDKLRELARRVDNVRDTADKVSDRISILKEPWFLFATSAVAGLALGLRRARPRAPALSATSARVIAPPSITSAVIREVLMAAAGSMTRRYIARLDER